MPASSIELTIDHAPSVRFGNAGESAIGVIGSLDRTPWSGRAAVIPTSASAGLVLAADGCSCDFKSQGKTAVSTAAVALISAATTVADDSTDDLLVGRFMVAPPRRYTSGGSASCMQRRVPHDTRVGQIDHLEER